MFWIPDFDHTSKKRIEEKKDLSSPKKESIVSLEDLDISSLKLWDSVDIKNKSYILASYWIFYNEDKNNDTIIKNWECINPEDGVFYTVYEVNRYCIYSEDSSKKITDVKGIDIVKWYEDAIIPLNWRFVDEDGDFSYFDEFVYILLPNDEKTKEFLIKNPCFFEQDIYKENIEDVLLMKIELKRKVWKKSEELKSFNDYLAYKLKSQKQELIEMQNQLQRANNEFKKEVNKELTKTSFF